LWKKNDKQWIWLAIDHDTRKIIGVHIGDRRADGVQSLWDSILEIYRQNATCYTDFCEAYCGIFPENRHHSVGKEAGQTNHD